MQNDYLNNKKIFRSDRYKLNYSQKINITKSEKVNINKLLNGVRINENNKKKEGWKLFGLATLLVGVMGIFITF
jgi:hypothetical protein